MKKSFIFSIALAYIITIPNIVNAQNIYKIYYLENTFEEKLNFNEYIFLGDFMDEYKIKLILKTFLQNHNEEINYIPEDTKVLNVKMLNKDLYINFNNNIQNYGGSNYETNMIRQILHTCFQFDDVERVTFLIDGKFRALPEGSLVFRYSRNDLELLDYNQSVHLKDKNHLENNIDD